MYQEPIKKSYYDKYFKGNGEDEENTLGFHDLSN